VQLQFLILVVLAVTATIFSIVTSIAMVVRKALELGRSRSHARLYEVYSGKFAELLLIELPSLESQSRASDAFRQYETLLAPVKQRLERMSPSRRRFQRSVLRAVLIDMTQDLTGESAGRLVYFFYSLGFVEEEIQLLLSSKWWIRAQAARNAGLMRARKSITALTAALEDPHPDVRHQAMQALIILVGVGAISTILRLSKNISHWTAIELSVIVAGFKEEAVPHLIGALESRDQSVVLFAVEMLAEVGFVTAVDPLMNLIRTSGDVRIQADAAGALGRLGDVRAKILLTELLAHRWAPVRLKALEALGKTGGPDIVKLLAPYLESETWEEKLTAARALATSGVQGLKVLQDFEKKHEDETSDLIRQVLEEFGMEPSHG
jgi:HEAT repeat protein